MTRFKPINPNVSKEITYDPRTGLFKWIHLSRAKKPGDFPGMKDKGQYKIQVNGETYVAHRLAWFLYYGEDPGNTSVDHKDRNPFNNKISNLRKATDKQQVHNQWNLGYRYYAPTNTFIVRIEEDGNRETIGYEVCPLLARIKHHDAQLKRDAEFTPEFLPEDFDQSQIIGYPNGKSCTGYPYQRSVGFYLPSRARKFHIQIWIDGTSKYLGREYCPLLARYIYLDNAKRLLGQTIPFIPPKPIPGRNDFDPVK